MTRIEAELKGEKRFSTGKPCRRGHVAERYVSTGNCVECKKLAAAKQVRGAGRYNTGEPCVRGHFSDRYRSNNSCVQCDLERKRARYHENVATRA